LKYALSKKLIIVQVIIGIKLWGKLRQFQKSIPLMNKAATSTFPFPHEPDGKGTSGNY
jgi:hypothetical protein